jgi:hypothetical protein
MNNNWQYKIQEFEAAVPQNAWANIANKLDADAAVEKNVVEKLQRFEEVPPQFSFEKISAVLDANNLQQKLINYTENPPSGFWQRILVQLQRNKPAKVVSIKKYKLVYRVAAAAAIVGIGIWSFNLFTNKTKLPKGEVVVAPTPAFKNVEPTITQPLQVEPNSNSTTANNVSKKNTKIAPQTKQSNNKTQVFIAAPNTFISQPTQDLAYDPSINANQKLQDVNGNIVEDMSLINTPNTYITIAGPDGQAVRVSSKFSKIANYFNGTDNQENIEVIIQESDKWRSIFAKWRDKMTNNAIAPSLTNFMDVIELSKVLEN